MERRDTTGRRRKRMPGALEGMDDEDFADVRRRRSVMRAVVGSGGVYPAGDRRGFSVYAARQTMLLCAAEEEEQEKGGMLLCCAVAEIAFCRRSSDLTPTRPPHTLCRSVRAIRTGWPARRTRRTTWMRASPAWRWRSSGALFGGEVEGAATCAFDRIQCFCGWARCLESCARLFDAAAHALSPFLAPDNLIAAAA